MFRFEHENTDEEQKVPRSPITDAQATLCRRRLEWLKEFLKVGAGGDRNIERLAALRLTRIVVWDTNEIHPGYPAPEPGNVRFAFKAGDEEEDWEDEDPRDTLLHELKEALWSDGMIDDLVTHAGCMGFELHTEQTRKGLTRCIPYVEVVDYSSMGFKDGLWYLHGRDLVLGKRR